MLEIFKIWICQIIESFCPSKITSNSSRQPSEHGGVSEWETNELYTGSGKGIREGIKIREGKF